jgi:hypothetical protein
VSAPIILTAAEWMAGARMDGRRYIRWCREADGRDYVVVVPAGERWRVYVLDGPAAGSLTVTGEGSARRSGAGDGWAERDGAGEGCERDSRGTRLKVEAPEIPYRCAAGDGWLRVGCELHTLQDWIARAEEIDDANGSRGLADATRALAQRLMDKED